MKKFEKDMRFKIIAVCAFILSLCLAFMVGYNVSQTPSRANRITDMEEQIAQTKREKSWITFFYKQYGAYIRYRDYGLVDEDIFALYGASAGDYLDISKLFLNRVCPPRGDGYVGDTYLYYGARLMPVPRVGGASDILTITYHGSAAWTHNNKSFDTYLSAADLGAEKIYKETPFGLMENWFSKRDHTPFLAGSHDYYRPFSYNSADVNGDGIGDFVLGDRLVLSPHKKDGAGFAGDIDAAPLVPVDTVFLPATARMASLIDGKKLAVSRYEDGAVRQMAETKISVTLAGDVPFTLMPLPAGFAGEDMDAVLLRTKDGIAVMAIDADGNATRKAIIDGFEDGQILTGGFGDFTGDGTDDVWIAQPWWKNGDDKIVGKIWLLAGGDMRDGSIDALTAKVITGSAKYTNYDGIGSSMSWKAGDIDADGLPDFTFTGHRHMDEAGALFAVTGKTLQGKKDISVESDDVIRILGEAVSQLAPPYIHWDASDYNGDGYDDIVVAADNDICSGLNAGALYILDGKKIIAGWAAKTGR